MGNYAILRTAKLKTFGNIGSSLSHNYRTRETLNADPKRTHLNRYAFSLTAEKAMENIKARIPEKRRKDAVLCIEYMITCSPGALQTKQEYEKYLEDGLRWLQERHGAENVVAALVHHDETTPHLAAYVVPLDKDGKLNAKKFLGGKSTLAAMQTSFAEKVGKKHGLERGIERSTARHTSIKEWYGLLNEASGSIEISVEDVEPKTKEKRLLLPDVQETAEEVSVRLNKKLEQLSKPIADKAKMFEFEKKRVDEIRNLVAETQRKLKDAEDRARKAEEQVGALRNVYESLTPPQQKNLVIQAKKNVKIKERCQRIVSSFYDSATGPVARLILRAKRALIEKKGNWWEVDWFDFDKKFNAEESLKTSHVESMQTLIDHSPSQANLTDSQVKKMLEMASVRDLEKDRKEALKPVETEDLECLEERFQSTKPRMR